MAGILNISNRLTSDLDALSVRNCDYKTRDHTAEDIKSCRTIFYDCLIVLFNCSQIAFDDATESGGINNSVLRPGRGASSPNN